MARQLGLAACGIVLWLLFGWQSLGTGQAPGTGVGGAAEIPLGGRSPDPGGRSPDPGGPAFFDSGASAKDVIGFSVPANRGGQLITLVNASQQWMAVYHIDGTGQIHLLSSRPISQDFAVEYNATVPLPKEMREISGK